MSFSFRDHQVKAIDATVAKLPGQPTFLDLAPGAGKTISGLGIADTLFKKNLIDGVAVLVPRLGLASQFEMDWRSVRPHFGSDAMGQIVHKTNECLDLSREQFGYVTSYQSLTTAPLDHLEFAKRYGGRFAIIMDEAHFLGVDVLSGKKTTKAARIVREIGKYARNIILMSGTVYREDGNQIVFASYDQRGILKSDVRVGYGDGVAQGFLRPFDATLFNAQVTVEKKSLYGSTYRYTEPSRGFSEGMSRIATDRNFWVPAVTALVEKVDEFQSLDQRYCGIAGCADQHHAKQVYDYLSSAGVRCLLATSDDAKSHENMVEFKRGGYDILVTVAMASIGYDHKPVIAIAALGGFRAFPFVDQFVMRAGRMWAERPAEEQVMHLFGMDDVRMRDYVNDKKSESQRGVDMYRETPKPKERKEHTEEGLRGGGKHIVAVRVTDGAALNSRNQKEEAVNVDRWLKVGLTDYQQRQQLRQQLSRMVSSWAYRRGGDGKIGDRIANCHRELKARDGKSVAQCSVDDLLARMVYVESQIGGGLPVQPEPVVIDVPPPQKRVAIQATLF